MVQKGGSNGGCRDVRGCDAIGRGSFGGVNEFGTTGQMEVVDENSRLDGTAVSGSTCEMRAFDKRSFKKRKGRDMDEDVQYMCPRPRNPWACDDCKRSKTRYLPGKAAAGVCQRYGASHA